MMLQHPLMGLLARNHHPSSHYHPLYPYSSRFRSCDIVFVNWRRTTFFTLSSPVVVSISVCSAHSIIYFHHLSNLVPGMYMFVRQQCIRLSACIAVVPPHTIFFVDTQMLLPLSHKKSFFWELHASPIASCTSVLFCYEHTLPPPEEEICNLGRSHSAFI